jgi:hypothetical protein
MATQAIVPLPSPELMDICPLKALTPQMHFKDRTHLVIPKNTICVKLLTYFQQGAYWDMAIAMGHTTDVP